MPVSRAFRQTPLPSAVRVWTPSGASSRAGKNEWNSLPWPVAAEAICPGLLAG